MAQAKTQREVLVCGNSPQIESTGYNWTRLLDSCYKCYTVAIRLNHVIARLVFAYKTILPMILGTNSF